MAELSDIARTPAPSLSEEMLTLCRSIKAKRPRVVIDHILKHGFVTNEELARLYGHAPRAARDVREAGIPLITYSVRSPETGKRIGVYTFDDVANVRAGRVRGRKAFSKTFKRELIEVYGERDAVTGDRLPERYLQIDHRVPYEVAGDEARPLDPRDFMLLDGSSNRAKSWSCEHCRNFTSLRDPAICRGCLWASPESYNHIAMSPTRRLELVWRDDEVKDYERLEREAAAFGLPLPMYIKQRLSRE